MKKKLIIVEAILCLIAILFLALQGVNPIFSNLALIPSALVLATIGINYILDLGSLKSQIEDEYPVFLAELFSRGQATREQVETKDRMFYKQHKKSYRLIKLRIWAFIIVAFGTALSLLIVFFTRL